MRLIDADDLDNVVLRLNEEGRMITRSEYKTVDSIIFEFPTIEAELVRRGRWIQKSKPADFCTYWWYECSACGDKPPNDRYGHPNYLSPYCPNCGAKMEEEEL